MNLLRRGTGALSDFVGVLRQVRTDDIAAEAERHFEIAVVGPRGAGKTTLLTRLAGGFGELAEPFSLRRLVELDTPLGSPALDAASQSDLVLWLQDVTQPYVDDSFGLLRSRAPAFLDVGNKADLLDQYNGGASLAEPRVLISALSSDSVRQQLVPRILECTPDLNLALGRTFAIFRPEVAQREIQRFARVNAEVAVVSAIPQASLILGPVAAVADTFILTKNQAILLLRLA
ncbi:MAG TPA: GTPase domain-containing protein, partial [Chloroflexota bacterium]|nr:GTPase domain-containing protein [Chloroflexota bacterium]